MDNSPKTLTCPSCGAPLDYDGYATFVLCKFCKTTNVLPDTRSDRSPITPFVLEEIRLLAQGGNMVEAVRRFRELSGLDLKSSKNAVDLLTSGKVKMANQVVTGPLTPEQTGHILEQVQELLRAGNKIEAIHRYREAADVSQAKALQVIEQVEAALKGLPAPQAPQIPGQPSFRPSTSTRKRRSWSAVILFLAIVLFVAGMLSLFLFIPGGLFKSMMVSTGPSALANPGGNGPVLAGVYYDVTDETRQVVLLDAVSGKPRWKAEPLPGEGYVDAILLLDDRVVVASESNLLAYHLDDGSLAWQTVMPDRLNYTDKTLVAIANRILTNTADQSIQAYDAFTGRLVWDRRLAGYDRSLRLLDGSLLIVDYTGDDYTYSLVFLDPLDGQVMRTITPTCSTSEYSVSLIDPGSGLLYDQEGNALYLVYDSSPGCIQRINLASGLITWETLDEEWYGFSSGFYGFFTDESLVFSSGNRLVSIDKSSGSLEVLADEEDYDLLPLAEMDGTLMVRLRRGRGTEHFELRGLESDSGGMLWQQDMGESSPIDPPDEMVGLVDEGYPGYTWHLGQTGLVLVHFKAAPNQMVIQILDPTDGSLVNETTVRLKAISGDFYSVPRVISWEGDLVYLEMDGKIYCINYLAGEVIFNFK